MIDTHVLNRGPLEYAAQRILCSMMNKWFADPQTET